MKQGRRAQKFISPHWWTLSLEECWIGGKAPKIRRDIVKDDTQSQAVFTEKGSSASLMTAAKGKDITSRLPCCAGQAADAVFACTQGKNGRCSKTIEKFPNPNVQTFGFVYHDTNGQNHGPVLKAQSFLMNEICMVILWQDCYGKGNLRKIPLQHGWEKVSNWECFFVHSEKGEFLSVCGWHQIGLKATWKVLNKEVDLEEPTSFLDHVYLGCTSKTVWNKQRYWAMTAMFESRISAGWTEKLPYSENFRISSWSYDMAGHAKKCVERYCELAKKTTQQLYKVSTPCIDDHHFKEKETKSAGDLSKSSSQIVLKCLHWHVLRPEILWSVNKFARAIAKWTRVCEKRLNRLIIIHVNINSIVMWVILQNSAAESRAPTIGVINVLDNVDLVPSNDQFSHQEAVLYVFENNKAVVKMIVKGRNHNETCFQDPQSLLSIGYSIESIWTQKSKSKTMTPETNSLTWNHMLCLFNISLTSTPSDLTPSQKLVTPLLPPQVDVERFFFVFSLFFFFNDISSKTASSKKFTSGTINRVRISVKASPAERRRRFHRNTLTPAFRVSTRSVLKVERRGLGV